MVSEEAPATAQGGAAPPVPVRLELPRRVMRRAGWVVAALVLVLLALGFRQAAEDIDSEMRASMSLAAAVARASQFAALSDEGLVEALRRQEKEAPLRHLALGLRDENGRLLVGRQPVPVQSAVWRTLLGWHQALWPGMDVAPLLVALPRADGRVWSLVLTARPDSERAETLHALFVYLGVLTLGGIAMLWVMSANVRRALNPLNEVVRSIGRLGAASHDAHAVAPAVEWPVTEVAELQAVTQALQHLDVALRASVQQRQGLTRQLLTLQEDERQRLARDLHDETGQRLTALRMEAAHLSRLVAASPPGSAADVQGAVQRLQTQCAQLQGELRQVLHRLAPVQGGEGGHSRLLPMLQALVEGWRPLGGPFARMQLVWEVPDDPQAPQPDAALVLALYRMSQEALTNVARHAQAQVVRLSLRQTGRELHWQVCDDGVGLADLAAAQTRGSGLAGLRERAWAHGAELAVGPGLAGGNGPGLCLRATFQWPASVAPDNCHP